MLSNNDGCVIARSQEAKDLGIPMGLPEFKGRHIFKSNNVKVLSSNYPLYGSMSKRVVKAMEHFVSNIEVYSIDESFLDLSNITDKNYKKFCEKIRSTVKQWTGIPISIGIASSKTLAKVANKIAKKDPSLNGVLDFTRLDEESINQYLISFDVSDIWGVGRKYTRMLRSHGIKNAYQLKQSSLDWIKSKMTIQGKRTVLELRGKSCIPLELSPSPQKAICCSKSFGRRVTQLSDLEEAISNYASRAAEKLRKGKQLTGAIQVFLHTSRFEEKKKYFNSKTISMPTSTCATSHIIKQAVKTIEELYKTGYKYKKCGIILLELTQAKDCQLDMFRDQNAPEFEEDIKLSKIMDQINNRWGRDSLKIASQGIENDWKMKQQKVSNRYTTVWSELMKVKC